MSNCKTPKLSIITICYNDRGLVRTSESIVNQVGQDFEWVVVDGGSNEEIQSLWDKYKFRIDTFVSEKDNGIYDAYNKGIKLANGEYLLFLNAGDCLNDKNVLRDIFENKNYDADILYGNMKYMKKSMFNLERVVKPSSKINDTFFITDNICTPSTFIKADLFNKYGGFNAGYKIAADLEKWIVFQQNGATFQKIERVVSKFDRSGISSDKKYNFLHKEELQKIYATHYSEEFYRQAIANYKRCLTPLQRVFSILNTKDGTKKEIRILNFLFTIERKPKEVNAK